MKKLILLFLLLTYPTATYAENNYTWNMSDIYKSTLDFHMEEAKLKKLLLTYPTFENHLNQPKTVLEFLKHDEQTSRMLEKLYLYSKLKQDLNINDKQSAELLATSEALYSDYLKATSFVEPELLSLSKKQFDTIKNDEQLKLYNRYFSVLERKKEHTLSKEEEELFATLSPLASDPEQIYNRLSRADSTYPIFTKNGKIETLTPALFSKKMVDKNRTIRKEAYTIYTKHYAQTQHTSAAVLYASIKKDELYAKARHYESGLDASLSHDNISEAVFNNALTTVQNHLPSMHKYMDLRRKVLKLDTLHSYDLFVPLVKKIEKNIPLHEAEHLLLQGLKPLGSAYTKNLEHAFHERWIDAHPSVKKYRGAYNWGTYDTHPFVLLNYDGTMDSVFTMAHELGHAMNSLLTNEKQPYMNANHSIFTAEVASTTNEWFMNDFAQKNVKTDDEKLSLLADEIDNIRGTVFTQMMYTEFEQFIHGKVQNDETLTAEDLNTKWRSLVEKYNGKSYKADDGIGWMKIPHFYSQYYVYKYATSMSASYALVDLIKNTQDGKEKYLNFLAAGSSKDPIQLLKDAGVDMTSPLPIEKLLVHFDGLVSEMETLLLKKKLI